LTGSRFATLALARLSPWHRFVLCCAGYLLGITAWSVPSPLPDDALPQPEPDQGIKAEFLYRFLPYVEWPAGKVAGRSSPIVIAVLGADDIAEPLRALVRGRDAGGRPVVVRRYGPGAALDGVHMLFVGRAESERVAGLAPVAQRHGVLLVTDYEGALDDGSAINLVVIENRVRFEVSLDATDKSGLKISSRMLAVALWVRPAS
jgi:uncharacterized protein DUF4154